MIKYVSFHQTLIIKNHTIMFRQKIRTVSFLVWFIHEVYFPILNIIRQLSYYICWVFSNILVNTPFYQLMARKLIIIILNMSWKTFSLCKLTWSNTYRFINNYPFLWYTTADSRPLTMFIVLKSPQERFRCDPTCYKIDHLCTRERIILVYYMTITLTNIFATPN